MRGVLHCSIVNPTNKWSTTTQFDTHNGVLHCSIANPTRCRQPLLNSVRQMVCYIILFKIANPTRCRQTPLNSAQWCAALIVNANPTTRCRQSSQFGTATSVLHCSIANHERQPLNSVRLRNGVLHVQYLVFYAQIVQGWSNHL